MVENLNFLFDTFNIELGIQILWTIFIAIFTYYTNFKIVNKKVEFNLFTIESYIIVIIFSSISVILKYKTNIAMEFLMMIFSISGIFSVYKVKNSITITLVSMAINYSIAIVSVFLNYNLNIIFNIQNDYINLVIIALLYLMIWKAITGVKKIKYGITYFKDSEKNEYMDMMVLNIAILLLLIINILATENVNITMNLIPIIIVGVVTLIITIKKMLQLYYKQKIMINEMQQLNEEIKAKDKEIQKLEQENLNFSKKSHSLAHKQKSLEYKLNQLLLNSEISEEQDLKNQLEQISTELYCKPVIDLAKTEITKIDDMLKFMQSECIKNNIDFNLQITGNVYYIINNLITEDQLEILIADHVKDAIIAIKHTDNINKSILVRLGKIDDIYGLNIYDSGVEFEKETKYDTCR